MHVPLYLDSDIITNEPNWNHNLLTVPILGLCSFEALARMFGRIYIRNFCCLKFLTPSTKVVFKFFRIPYLVRSCTEFLNYDALFLIAKFQILNHLRACCFADMLILQVLSWKLKLKKWKWYFGRLNFQNYTYHRRISNALTVVHKSGCKFRPPIDKQSTTYTITRKESRHKRFTWFDV